jgi:hypothetical protein
MLYDSQVNSRFRVDFLRAERVTGSSQARRLELVAEYAKKGGPDHGTFNPEDRSR